MATGRIVAGLDIGTTKITTIIAEVDQGGGVDVIGVGQSPSQGIERGMVMNLEETVQSIMRSVSEAQHMADVKIDSVYTGIAGDHISGINNRAAVTVGRANNEITQEDVMRVIAHAKNVDIPPDLQVIHVIPQEFSVDSQKHVREPIGLAGSRLEGEVHIVTGSTTAVQNIRRAVERAGLNVAEIVLQPLASSYAVLMPDEQDHGVVMLDVGGGTTDIAIFYRRCIRHTAVIGLGGTNVTNDISIGIKTPLSEAENLKMQYGCAMRDLLPQDREIHPAIGLGGEPAESVSQHHLADVVESRMEEIYEYAWREVGRTEWADMLNSGVVLTGGGSMIKGAVELARRVFGVSVKLGLPTGVGGLVEKVSTPMHATGVGLVLYGAQQDTTSPEAIQSYSENESSDSTDRLGGVYRWLREFFTG
jgi:cell division protein FtsA